MAFGTITSTENTFGSVDGTTTGVVPGTLTGSVGVPGPAGPGVPAGGLEGQIIVKASDTSYDTVWVDNAAETLTATVRNETGATLTKGTVVYITGAAGNKALVSKASASSEATSSKTFAILAADIVNNQNGTAVTVGLLKNLNTSGLTEGGSLWLSTTAGEWTQTMPTAPNHAVFLGTVTRVHATQGTVEVRIQNGYELQELHNVKITSVSNGQVLKYDSAQSLWVNGLDVGVPVGGTAGQFLTKIDGTNYNTDWTTVNLSAYAVKANNLSDLTSASTARTNLGLGTMATATAADYSTTAVANGLYYPLSSNPAGYLTSASLTGYATESWVTSQGYITSSALSPYLLSSTAASTYQTIAGMSSYLTTASAASAYAALGGANFTGVVGFNGASGNVAAKSTGWFKAYTSGFENTDYSLQYDTGLQVVVGGTTVARIAASGILAPSAGITFSDASTQTSAGITAATAASTYLTQSSAASTYYLQTNPAGYITSAALSGYATESFVTSQGYITSAALSPYLTSATAASTYFTIANAANKADLASPTFTGVPAAPTASPGTNTTQLATTAFVTAAVPAFGATADINDPVSTTKAASIDNVRELLLSPGYQMFYQGAGVNGTSGAGAAVNANSGRWKEYVSPNAGVAGHAKGVYDTTAASIGFAGYQRGANLTSRNWSKKIWMSGRSMIGHFSLTSYNGSANTFARISLGGYTAIGAGDMSAGSKGIGWRLQGGGSSALELQVSNGSTVTTVTSSFTPTLKQCFDWEIYSDGAGNVTLFVNDSQVATTTAGPTGTQTSGLYMEGMDTTASSTSPFIMNNLGTKIFVAI